MCSVRAAALQRILPACSCVFFTPFLMGGRGKLSTNSVLIDQPPLGRLGRWFLIFPAVGPVLSFQIC